MMALDTCNASVQHDIASAQQRYKDLSLDSFPAEDVTELATEALRLIHILAGSYALPLTLGSMLIKKVTSTSSEFFNCKIFALLDEIRTLETKYKLLDPAAMAKDPLSTLYGPYTVCAKLQEEHGKLISDSDWPALATKLPESNTIPVTPDQSPTNPSSTGQNVQCYKCKQLGHKANNPSCPMYNKSGKRDNSSGPPTRLKPKDPWKYVEPRDLSKPAIIDDKEFFWHQVQMSSNRSYQFLSVIVYR